MGGNNRQHRFRNHRPNHAQSSRHNQLSLDNENQSCVQGSLITLQFIFSFKLYNVFLTAEPCEGDNQESEELTQPKIKLAMWV